MHRTARLTMHVGALLALSGLLFLFAHAQEHAEIELPQLDLDTLEAEAPEGTLHAQRAERSFVGEIAAGRIIGIAFRSDIGDPPDTDDDRQIVVHLYDGQEPALLLGAIDEQGAASLQTTETVFFDATVDLVMQGDVVTGTVTYGDEDPMPFTASAASGVGGVYWAVGEDDWEYRSAEWVVTPDGRQWGALCMPMEPWVYWCFMQN
jgi:hypothetical protein